MICDYCSSGKFVNPESGEAMTLGRAVHQGHLAPKTQWKAYSYKTHQQQHAGPPSPGSVISSASHKVLLTIILIVLIKK